MNLLRPYQCFALNAILDSVLNRRGLTFTVEIARQGGKNELSAQLELQVLTRFKEEPLNIVKCSPTFRPQAVISMDRLKQCLGSYEEQWESENGYIIRVGNARAIFLSADESSSVVGHTAHLLLEIDEAQDVSRERYAKAFKPMAASTNATKVLYGTAWNDTTLLEEAKQTNLELERKDGIKRHFEYDWQEVARYNPDYLAYVEGERHRLGEDHPLFRTQYRLLPVTGGGGFFTYAERAQLQGTHLRQHRPLNPGLSKGPKPVYVAGLDLAGESEQPDELQVRSLKPRLDSTILTIAQLDFAPRANDAPSLVSLPRRGEILDGDGAGHGMQNPSLSLAKGAPASPFVKGGLRGILADRENESFRNIGSPLPAISIVQYYAWTGIRHAALYAQLVDLFKNVWRCQTVVVDSTGIGQPVASFLRQALGSRIRPLTFTVASKSHLGFELLAAVNSGRLKMYASDCSPEYQEFWFEMESARSHRRPNQTIDFYVDPTQGHDDFLTSLALVVAAADDYQPRIARGIR